MSAISRSRPPHRGHARTSKPNVRCINIAHDRLGRSADLTGAQEAATGVTASDAAA
jgi:hypothetical protein